MMIWEIKHPRATPEWLGFLPGMLNPNDPRKARDQFAANYVSGWMPFSGVGDQKLTLNEAKDKLLYPGDPPMQLIAETRLRDELIRLFECDWVAIIQPDGDYEVARMD